MNLDAPRVLVLNAAYEVLGLASIKRAVLLVLGGGAEMVSESGLYLNSKLALMHPGDSYARGTT